MTASRHSRHDAPLMPAPATPPAPTLTLSGGTRLTKQLATVTGVEVTTYNPRFGHFGVFPFPATNGVPPFKGATAGGVRGLDKGWICRGAHRPQRRGGST